MGINQRAAVAMTDDEVSAFVVRSRTATLATRGPDGVPHLVAMWFGWFDGSLWFETKAKSQKAVNLRRDPTVVVMIEAGDTYDQLRGVSIEGTAHLVEDPGPFDPKDEYWAAAVNVYERYHGPYSEEARPLVELMMNKRIVVRVEPVRVRSWDHRKLGLPAMPLGGTTAAHLHDA
jgi:PPOX class probable F420-dependent enzyme